MRGHRPASGTDYIAFMHQSIQQTSNQECTTEGRPASDPECTTKGRPTAAPGPAAACAALPPPPAAAAAPLPGTAGGAGCGLRAARAPATPPSRRSPGKCLGCGGGYGVAWGGTAWCLFTVCGGYGVCVCGGGVRRIGVLRPGPHSMFPQLRPRPLTGHTLTWPQGFTLTCLPGRCSSPQSMLPQLRPCSLTGPTLTW